MLEELTERAREAVVRAQDEARTMRTETVQPEHELLGLFCDQDGIPGQVFADLGITVEAVRDLVRHRLGTGSAAPPEGPMPFSSEATQVCELASRMAVGMGEPVGTQYQLLAITRLSDGGAYQILRALDVDPGLIRFEIKKRAWPTPNRGTRARPELRLVRSAPLDR